MENIKNCASWQSSDPLSLRITGTGAYLKKTCSNLVKMFEDAEYDKELEMRSDLEDKGKDDFYDR